MQGLSVFMICLGLVGILSFSQVRQRHSEEAEQARAVALNFAQYRRAVDIHALANPGISGTISQPILGLSTSWEAVRPWSNMVTDGHCYVFGPVSARELRAAKKLFLNSYCVGVKQGGRLVTFHGTGIALPDEIPEGNLVSAIQL